MFLKKLGLIFFFFSIFKNSFFFPKWKSWLDRSDQILLKDQKSKLDLELSDLEPTRAGNHLNSDVSLLDEAGRRTRF